MSYPLIDCPTCGLTYDYRDSVEKFRQRELPLAPPSEYFNTRAVAPLVNGSPRQEAEGLGDHFKSGQRLSGQNRPTRASSGTKLFYLTACRGGKSVLLCANSTGRTEHVAVMEEVVEQRGDAFLQSLGYG